jgi:multiple sugar transport system permease protein
MNRMRVEEALWAWAFILPSVLGLMVFTIIPIFSTFILSAFSWDFLTPPEFIGVKNFERLATDTRLMTGFGVTATYVVAHVVLTALLGLILALAVTRKISTVLRSSLRAAYFFPVIVSTASVAIIWTYMYHQELGIINYYLKQLGLQSIPWLNSSVWALWSVIIMSVWKSVGFNFVLFVAGLQNIPREYYEAAEIDGAGYWSQFFYITAPLLSPTVLFILIMGLIGSFQVFDAPYIMTTGGPGDATRTVGIFIYEHGLRFLRMGYASTIALVLFSIIMVLTIIQFSLSKKWVVY